MTKVVVADIETLDVRSSSVVLSFGFTVLDTERYKLINGQESVENVFFDLLDEGQEIFFDVDAQLEKGRTISKQTTAFWEHDNQKEAKKIIESAEKINPKDLIKSINTEFFYADCDITEMKWYVRGPHFDIAIMDSLFQDFQRESPWNFWDVRDIRTLFDFWPDHLARLPEPKAMIKHNSLHDSAWDAVCMLHFFNYLMPYPVNIK